MCLIQSFKMSEEKSWSFPEEEEIKPVDSSFSSHSSVHTFHPWGHALWILDFLSQIFSVSVLIYILSGWTLTYTLFFWLLFFFSLHYKSNVLLLIYKLSSKFLCCVCVYVCVDTILPYYHWAENTQRWFFI